MRVLNFGSLNIDRVYEVKNFVEPNATILCENYQELLGGKGLNQSIALAKAGVSVQHVGAIGLDGQALKQALVDQGVATDYLQEFDSHSGHAVIQLDAQGANCIIVEGGTNQLITQAFIDQVLDENQAQSEEIWVLVQNEVSNVDYILKQAHAKGYHLIVNPSPINDKLLASPLELVDLFLLNEVEAYHLSGEKETNQQLQALVTKYPHAEFVLTLGEKGAIYATGDQQIHQEAFLTKAVDTTAAGDTFTGYYIQAIFQKQAIQDCLKQACMASSIAIQTKGAVNSIPDITQVQTSLRKEIINE